MLRQLTHHWVTVNHTQVSALVLPQEVVALAKTEVIDTVIAVLRLSLCHTRTNTSIALSKVTQRRCAHVSRLGVLSIIIQVLFVWVRNHLSLRAL